MPRTIKLTIEYDGTDFHGWQVQPGLRTVQGELQAALRQMTGEDRCARGAGRTDAGVHALGQVATFTTETAIPLEGFRRGLGRLTPPDIGIRAAEEVPEGFDARFSATGKRYRYRLLVAPAPSALRRHVTHWVVRPVDVDAMRAGAAHLVGRHDFAAMHAADDHREDAVRTVFSIDVRGEGDEVVIDVVGEGFLKNMVRIIAGTLLEVGTGKHAPAWIAEVLATRDRRRAGPTLPAQGLCLVEVLYEPVTP
jgi:tRNA pseudouridine38-40 synthase